jgi:hypothetical protein
MSKPELKVSSPDAKPEFSTATEARKAARDGLFSSVDAVMQNSIRGGQTTVEINVTTVDTDLLQQLMSALSSCGYSLKESSHVRNAENLRILKISF